MSMQMDACLKMEQIGTLFVLVGAPEGGFGGGGVQLKNHTCLFNFFFLAPPGTDKKMWIMFIALHYAVFRVIKTVYNHSNCIQSQYLGVVKTVYNHSK